MLITILMTIVLCYISNYQEQWILDKSLSGINSYSFHSDIMLCCNENTLTEMHFQLVKGGNGISNFVSHFYSLFFCFVSCVCHVCVCVCCLSCVFVFFVCFVCTLCWHPHIAYQGSVFFGRLLSLVEGYICLWWVFKPLR